MNWRDKAGNKIKRNDPCPCGSGKKFKRCCFLKIVNPLYEKCSCGSGKLLKDCCLIKREYFGICKACGVGRARGAIRADGSVRFKCPKCGYKFNSRKA